MFIYKIDNYRDRIRRCRFQGYKRSAYRRHGYRCSAYHTMTAVDTEVCLLGERSCRGRQKQKRPLSEPQPTDSVGTQ
jgi:hypothetical protein